VPPLNDTVVVAGTATTVPPQVLLITPGGAINNPDCTPTKLSVQLAFVNGNVFGLNTVILSTDVAPASINIGVNCLLISAGMAIAYAVCTGNKNKDPVKAINKNKDLNDLNILYLLAKTSA
jgi:hypothetical protein